MTITKPFISVIIPTFNRERYLAEAIASVLNQTTPPDEIIVVDDGSTDGSSELIKQFPSVRYYSQPNSGAAVARNQGVQLAQGNFLAFLDSDDLWMPNKLTQQLSALEANPQLDMVFGHIQQIYSPELDETARQKIRILKEVLSGYHVGTMLIRQDAFLQVGDFETHLQCGEFISWYLRAVDSGLQVAMLPEVVMQRRLHQTNLGRADNLDRSDYLKIIKASLDRRRIMEQSQVAQEPEP